MSKDEQYNYLALSQDDKKEPLIGEDTLKRNDSSNILNDLKTLSHEETPYIPDKEEEDKDFKQQQSSSSDDDSSHAEKNATIYKKQQDEAIRKLTWVCVICTIFMIIEIIGGYLANSIAIMSDAAHLLSDLLGFLISIIQLYLFI